MPRFRGRSRSNWPDFGKTISYHPIATSRHIIAAKPVKIWLNVMDTSFFLKKKTNDAPKVVQTKMIETPRRMNAVLFIAMNYIHFGKKGNSFDHPSFYQEQ